MQTGYEQQSGHNLVQNFASKSLPQTSKVICSGLAVACATHMVFLTYTKCQVPVSYTHLDVYKRQI